MRKEEQINVLRIRFLGEQNGNPENTFKEHVSPRMKQFGAPLRAYLCQVQYDNQPDINVALCIFTKSLARHRIKTAAMEVFRNMFNEQTHLDCLFLTPKEEENIRAVCPAFLEME